MPTMVIPDISSSTYANLQRIAEAKNQTLEETVRMLLENTFSGPLPDEPYLTEEISAPFSIPHPPGRIVHAKWVSAPLPEPHDFPDEE